MDSRLLRTAAALGVGTTVVAVLATGTGPALATGTGTALATPRTTASLTESTGTAAPQLSVLTETGGLAPGYLFTGPKTEGPSQPGVPNGPLISDNEGRPAWFKNLPAGLSATDFRVQRYQGKRVLTYWEGNSLAGFQHGDGTDYILNRHYQVIATVKAADGLDADQHEFWLTKRGTALITSYHETTVDASSVGGPTDQDVLEGVVQEINIRTGKVVFQWHSLNHVPLSDSHEPLPDSASTPWDYFHINAVRPDKDGNLLISARHTWTVYKVNRTSGDIIWELGGKQSSFALGSGVRFAWQHDPKPEGHGDYRIFDNESDGTPVRPESRVITVHVDTKTHRATLLRSVTHPDHLSAPSQGNSQLLPNGDLLVGWGQLGRVTEFSPSDQVLFDATVPQGQDTYRAYRDRWNGQPLTRPTLTATSGQDSADFDVVWNGATNVTQWRLLTGNSPKHLHAYGTVRWDGLDTQISGPPADQYVQAEALNGNGRVIRRSDVVSTD